MPPAIRPMTLVDYDPVRDLWQATEGVGLNDFHGEAKAAGCATAKYGLLQK
jgi:hypothetical protein